MVTFIKVFEFPYALAEYRDLPLQAYSGKLGFGYFDPMSYEELDVFGMRFKLKRDEPYFQVFCETDDSIVDDSTTITQLLGGFINTLRSSRLKGDKAKKADYLDAIVEFFLHNSRAFGFS